MQSIKKWMVLTLCLVLMATMMPLAGFAAGPNDFSDMPNDWSTPALKKAVENGLLTGSNGMIMPKSNLTRAQMAAILVRAFGANKLVNVSMFSDINTSQWYFKDISKAYAMGIFQGTGDKMNPEKYITREEVFTVLARALNLDPGKETSNWKFRDSTEISSWAKTSVAAMIEAGYISGSGGMLNPKANMTRAEFAALMDRIAKYYIRKEGTYTGTYDGSVMITVPGVILKDVTINGDLIIGDGVSDGEIILENVTILGRTIVRGLAQLVEGEIEIEDEQAAAGAGGVPGGNNNGNNPNPPNPPNPPIPPTPNTDLYGFRLIKGDTRVLLTEDILLRVNDKINFQMISNVYSAGKDDFLATLTNHNDFIEKALTLKSERSGKSYAFTVASRILNYTDKPSFKVFKKDEILSLLEEIIEAKEATTTHIEELADILTSYDISNIVADLELAYNNPDDYVPEDFAVYFYNGTDLVKQNNLLISDLRKSFDANYNKYEIENVVGKIIFKVQFGTEVIDLQVVDKAYLDSGK